jgi:hypothetical protein
MLIDNAIRKLVYTAGWAMALATLVPLGLAEGSPSKAKPYPLKTCIVSDGRLGDMGAPYLFTYQGREIKLCCKGCLKEFNKEPAKYVRKLDQAEKAALTPAAPPQQPHGGHH